MAKRTTRSLNKKATSAKKPNALRIIGGEWRGRKLQLLPTPGLRPTPDRVKETLFNWLREDIYHARCLDLFCGSGALGLEALSRQARDVTFVDSNKTAIRQLMLNCQLLGTSAAHCYLNTAEDWLNNRDHQSMPYHIIFLDPPYRQGMIDIISHKLEDNHFTTDQTQVYIETEKELQSPALPANWQCIKQKTAGQVSYGLYLVHQPEQK